MDSFQDIIGWKRTRKREDKNYQFRSVPTRRVIENIKKVAKKFKNTIMDTFQAKIGLNSPRKRENKNYCSVPFKPGP